MTKIEEFRVSLENRQNEINIRLGKLYQDENILSISSNYAIINGGKRLRPILLVEFANLFSEIDENIYNFAIGLELIHNYSLVHDDLPSMDNDDYRRGNLTVHKKYGEDIAILVGDNLLNKSYEIILDTISNSNEKDRYIEASRYLATKSGEKGMIGGQILDIGNRFTNIESLLNMYIKKTCGLIKSGCRCGAILGGGNSKEVDLAEEFGEMLGLAFQIQDDLLDFDEDKKIGKQTVANFETKELAVELLDKYSKRAICILKEIKGNTEFLEGLVEYLINRKY